MGFYNDRIAPHIVSAACGLPITARQRKKLVPRARGRVLEIGMGSGHNLRFYDPDKVEMLWGLEPGETMRRLAAPRVKKLAFDIEFLDLPGEQIPLDDKSADTVVTTFSLCTIPNPIAALEGMRRVLKPGGELLFLEHGADSDPNVHRWQHRLEPLWKTLFGGCHLTRPIPELIEVAGFEVCELVAETIPEASSPRIPAAMKVAAFEYLGVARYTESTQPA
jgi:ubiquinone/menaquinone biosynthesis C-methylase UbiE